MNCQQWFSQWVANRLGLQLSVNQAKSLLEHLGKPPDGANQSLAELFWNGKVENASEWNELVTQATNNESSFFREAPFYRLFEDILGQRILRKELPLKVLSAGCAAGQEIYSCAIIAHKKLGSLSNEAVELYGVDVDKEALNKGRHGLYHKWDLRGLTDEQKERYIEELGNDEFKLCSQIRDNVTLRCRNLMDPWPTSLHDFFDVVLLRNVVVHFDKIARKTVIDHLKELVKPGGILVFAATEIPNVNEGTFIREEWNGFFYLRKPIEVRKVLTLNAEYDLPATNVANQLRAKPHIRSPKSSASFLTSSRGASVLTSPRCETSANLPSRKAALSIFTEKSKKLPCEMDVEREIRFAFNRYSQGKFEEALEICSACLKLSNCVNSEEEGTFKVIEGLSLRALGQLNEALAAFTKGTFLLPLSWVGHFHKAELLYQLERGKEAQQCFIKASRCLALHQGPLLDALFIEDFPSRQMLAVCQDRIARCASLGAR